MDVIQRLDAAQENRDLTQAEFRLRLGLKRRLLGYAVIERARKKQASRITNIKEGDANTKYFHRKVNARKKKKPHFPFKEAKWMGCYTRRKGRCHCRPFPTSDGATRT